MSVWHGNLKKKKPSGGRKRAYRRKRKFEKGFFPVETELAKPKRKNVRGRSKNFKVKILSDNYACVSDKKNGKTEKVKITIIDYDESHFQEKEAKTIEECFSFKDTPTVTWINIDGVHQLDIIEKIGSRFGFHSLWRRRPHIVPPVILR